MITLLRREFTVELPRQMAWQHLVNEIVAVFANGHGELELLALNLVSIEAWLG